MNANNDSHLIAMELPADEIDATEVVCPLVGNQVRPVRDCLSGCEHFGTVRDKIPDDRKGREFHERYIVGCRYPTARPLFKRYQSKDAS